MSAFQGSQSPPFVQQSGTVTPGHVLAWTTDGVVQDAGTPLNPGATTLGLLNSSLNAFGIANAPPTEPGPFSTLTLGYNPATGNAALNVMSFNGATPIGFEINVNGITYPFPGGSVRNNFTVANGQIFKPNGERWQGQGFCVRSDTLAQTVTNAACQPLTTLAPLTSFVVIASQVQVGYTVDAFIAQVDQAIQWLTGLGIVACIVNYENTWAETGGATGDVLVAEAAWFTALAQRYASNPYVWFITGPNEGTNVTDTFSVSIEQNTIYNAIRAAGNSSLVGFDPIGFPPSTNAALMPDSAGHYSNMTGIFWGVHTYGWEPAAYTPPLSEASPTDCNFVISDTAAQMNYVQSLDGVIPVLCTEFGNATGGQDTAIDGAQMIEQITTFGVTVNQAYAAWIWFWPGSGSINAIADNCVFPNAITTLTPGYGTTIVFNMLPQNAP
jgi:hypothetical protein